jgi:1-acyl-sn-glycerol-3-phosphate acyltransferase
MVYRAGDPGRDPDGPIKRTNRPNGNASWPVILAADPVPRGWAAGQGTAPGWTAPRWARADGTMSGGPAGPPGSGSRDDRAADSWLDRLADLADFARRQVTGEGEIDEFGFDPEFNSRLLIPLARVLYQQWFQVQLRGLEHVPASGPALLAANHSGVLPVDAIMLQTALHDEHPAHRDLRLLGADLVYEVPWLGYLARRAGHIRACPENAHRLLADGEVVGVFPEGFKGIGKPFSERYQLRRFGRGGFVVSALRAGVPIIPCAIVGAEEIYPMLASAGPLADMLGLPYFPVTPLFPWLGPVGAIPLPSRWIIEFCPPVETAGHPAGAWRDQGVVDSLTEEVRGTVQKTLDRLLDERGPAFG